MLSTCPESHLKFASTLQELLQWEVAYTIYCDLNRIMIWSKYKAILDIIT